MSSTEEPKETSPIREHMFELLKVGLTLVLTGLIGGGITYYYQNRAHIAQRDQADLETARQSALKFLREVGDILEQRRGFALRVLDTIQENAPPKEKEQAWNDYMKAVDSWNVKWNIYRALVLEQFGSDMQKKFYDEKADSETDWAKYSITGKLMNFHNTLEELHKGNPDKPTLDPKAMEKLYSSISQDTYNFYSEVIEAIQKGNVGKKTWNVGNAKP
jgi:hypothetical protein